MISVSFRVAGRWIFNTFLDINRLAVSPCFQSLCEANCVLAPATYLPY